MAQLPARSLPFAPQIHANTPFSQVGVAVLLNSFLNSSDSAKQAERGEALAARKVPYTLDPLLASLARAFVDDADLSDRLRRLFQVHVSHSVGVAGHLPLSEGLTDKGKS